MINWDPAAQTARSDEEVIHKEVQSRLYHVAYRISGTDDSVTIATTRPETILADTAVCVHPDDSRYRDLIENSVIVPLAEREVAVIGDRYVDPEYGSGSLKVTPAHRVTGDEMGGHHDLEGNA